MKKIFFYALFNFFGIVVFAQPSFDWGAQVDGTSADRGHFIRVDHNYDVINVGIYSGDIDLDPGPGSIIDTADGIADIFVQKLDSNGVLVWAKMLKGPGWNVVNCVEVDTGGNIYLTGQFTDSMDIDPGISTNFLYASSQKQVFAVKLDSQGNLKWGYSFGGPDNYDTGHSILPDNVGNVYVSGLFSGSSDFDPGPGTHVLVGDTNFYLVKLKDDGTFIWAKGGQQGSAGGYALGINSNFDVFATGEFSGAVDFDFSTNVDSHVSNGQTDFFVQKIDSSGNYIWSVTGGGKLAERSQALGIDENDDVWIGGHYRDTVDFDFGPGVQNEVSKGGSDIYVLKLDSSGNLLNDILIGGTGDDMVFSVLPDYQGKVFFSGVFSDTVDFDSGPNSSLSVTNGNWDCFIERIDVVGNYNWSLTFGGSGMDFPLSCIDNRGNIYSTGMFSNTIDLNPFQDSLKYTANGSSSNFVQKLSDGNVLSGLKWVEADNLLIYPNPTTGQLNISLKSSIASRVSIFNVLGELIISKQFYKPEFSIDIPGPFGLYLIQIETEEGMITKRVVKE